jgi:flavin reductase (DIM6/NTAB) family NADH-FMN oxidoreductase RutF
MVIHMPKLKFGADTLLYPMPVTLVGADVNGKPNFLTVAFCGIMNPHPPMIYAALNKAHHTNSGIRENRTFSVNIPSADMVSITDYCGIFSGRDVDKSGIFDVFYGELGNAPMIAECPISMECRLHRIIEFEMDEVFIGEIVQSYVDPECLTDGLPDIKKMSPMTFSMRDNNYWRLGEGLGRAWSIGKEFKKDTRKK